MPDLKTRMRETLAILKDGPGPVPEDQLRHMRVLGYTKPEGDLYAITLKGLDHLATPPPVYDFNLDPGRESETGGG